MHRNHPLEQQRERDSEGSEGIRGQLSMLPPRRPTPVVRLHAAGCYIFAVNKASVVAPRKLDCPANTLARCSFLYSNSSPKSSRTEEWSAFVRATATPREAAAAIAASNARKAAREQLEETVYVREAPRSHRDLIRAAALLAGAWLGVVCACLLA